ncbi:hypothetical protein OG895_20750 [Streptomyces sp. NBC_00201]|nr:MULTISPECIES: hypothetical protein [unclassified Streptomyces]MCX5055544.1 hypothetical protein [Streptomyces sp. NBC_00452]MCX5247610.1 hypothetical protein [Streptomyces sp. NBC_00201]MCX5286608.1 hypothetical protein [Streptomyces sp. NBC_00183]
MPPPTTSPFQAPDFGEHEEYEEYEDESALPEETQAPAPRRRAARPKAA